MRNMAFSHTAQQMREGTKTVTRRKGWAFLKPGDKFCAIVKGQGLKKGEHVERIGVMEVISVGWEPLAVITQEEVWREGFLDMEVWQFLDYCETIGLDSGDWVNRIEFKRTD